MRKSIKLHSQSKYIRFATLSLSVILLSSPLAQAQTPSPDGVHSNANIVASQSLFSKESTFKIDGSDFDAALVHDAFLNASVARNYKADHLVAPLLSPENLPKNSNIAEFIKPEVLEKRYPWLYPLIYQKGSSKNFLSIHKWEKPVSVSLGWPNDFKPYADLDLWNSSKIDRVGINTGGILNPDVKKWAVEEIQLVLPDIKSSTNLPISYIAHDQENLNVPANLRIVLVHNAGWENNFKPGFSPSQTTDSLGLQFVESVLPYMSFTPGLSNQVSGYYVPSSKGEIQFAVCKIWDGHPKPLFQALVKECLVRSMGFTGLSILPHSILGPWATGNNSGSIPSPNGLTESDKLFLKTLYDKRISAGENISNIFR